MAPTAASAGGIRGMMTIRGMMIEGTAGTAMMTGTMMIMGTNTKMETMINARIWKRVTSGIQCL